VDWLSLAAADLWVAGGMPASSFGVITCLSYLLAYTPLRSARCGRQFVGAISWRSAANDRMAAATGSLGSRRGVLFAILFLCTIRTLHNRMEYRDDYSRAGILMLPVVDKDGTRTFRQIILTSIGLIGIGLLPRFSVGRRALFLRRAW